MPSAGDKAATGAAQGASAGMAFGPWGALIGGVAGGAMGYLSGDDPYQRNPYLQRPDSPGGVLGNYGGMYRDPVTGLVTYTDNNFSGANSDLMRNRYLQDRLQGGTGAGATNDLDAQILFQQSIVDRYLNPKATTNKGVTASEYVDEKFLNPKTGKIWDDSTPEGHAALRQLFDAEVPGGKYKGKSMKNSMGFWLTDRMQEQTTKFKEYEAANKSNTGNQQISDEALKAAQSRLAQLKQSKQQFAEQTPGLQDNPFLKYLDQQRDPRYKEDIDRWRGQADKDFDQMQKKAELPFNTGDDYGVAGFDKYGKSTDPDSYNFNAAIQRGEYNGPTVGDYTEFDPTGGNALRESLNRAARNNMQTANLGRDENMARRGLLSSAINEVGRAGDVARLGDAQAGAQIAGINLSNDLVGRNNQVGAMRFQDRFNAAMEKARTGQWAANANMQREGDLFNRAKNIDDTRYGRQNNEFGLQQQLQQQWRNNALQSLGVQGGLEDRLQGLDRQNFADRMGFSNFLEGQSNNAFNQEMQRNQMTMNQGGQGMGINMNMAGLENSRNMAQQQMENSSMNAANQMAANNSANNQAMWGNLIQTGMQGFNNWQQNRQPQQFESANAPGQASRGLGGVSSISDSIPTARPNGGVSPDAFMKPGGGTW